MVPFYFFLLVIASFLNAGLQILLKVSAPYLIEIAGSPLPVFQKMVKLIFNPYLISVGAVMLGGVILYLKVLSKTDLSRAYPINVALTVVFTMIGGLFLLQEQVTLPKLFGAILITVGIVFLMRN